MADLGWTMLLCSFLFACGFGLSMLMFPSTKLVSTTMVKGAGNQARLSYAFRLLWQIRPLRRLTGLTLGVNLMDGALMAVLPAIVITRFEYDETMIGYLNSLAAIAVILTMFLLLRVMERLPIHYLGYSAMIASSLAIAAIAVAPNLGTFTFGFVAYFVMKSVFVLFLRTERVLHIPAENLGIVLGVSIAVVLSTIPLSGFLIAWIDPYLSVSALLFGAIALASLSHIYFILSTWRA